MTSIFHVLILTAALIAKDKLRAFPFILQNLKTEVK